jgi:beta-lactamase regulating signal transducer with metallopeptidase domain
MSLSLDWFNQIAAHWWSYVVQTGWQAALVGMILLLVVHLAGRRWPAPLRYAILVLALLKFACPPLLPIPSGVCSPLISPKHILPQLPERKPGPVTEPRAIERVGVSGLDRTTNWVGGFMVVHLLGAAALAALVLARARRLRRLVRASCSRLGGRLHDDYRDLAIELGVYPIPCLVISDEVDSPMAFGFSNRAIILPAKLVDHLAPTELRAVLAHELAHCQRGDLWVNWVQLILLAAWWFHPIIWFVNRSLREVREDCCDDLLLARGLVSNDAYCDVLLRAAAELSPALPLSSALGLGGQIHPLGRRMARITDWTLRRCENVSAGGAAAVLLSAALLLPGLGESEAKMRPGVRLEPAANPPNRAVVSRTTPMRTAPATRQISVNRVQAGRAPNAGRSSLFTGSPMVGSGANVGNKAAPIASTPPTRGGIAAASVAQARIATGSAQPGPNSPRPAFRVITPGVLHASNVSLGQPQPRFIMRGSYRSWPASSPTGQVTSYGVWVDRLPWSDKPGLLPTGSAAGWSLAWGRTRQGT